jgi:hypothetical protein
MLIELGYQLYIHVCYGTYLGNIYIYIQIFCTKRPDGGSGCQDGKVDSSERPSTLSGRACFCNLLCGTMYGRHLSSIRMVSPVGLYRIPLASQPSHSAFFGSFCRLVHFFCAFMRIYQVYVSSLQFISSPGMFLYFFTNLF